MCGWTLDGDYIQCEYPMKKRWLNVIGLDGEATDGALCLFKPAKTCSTDNMTAESHHCTLTTRGRVFTDTTRLKIGFGTLCKVENEVS